MLITPNETKISDIESNNEINKLVLNAKYQDFKSNKKYKNKNNIIKIKM